MKDSIRFADEKVGHLFRRFLLPTVLGMVSSAVFIVTDGIFVGRGIGSDALAAVNIVAPLYTLATGFGLMFGMGGSIVASINLSRGKRRIASINITQSAVVPTLLLVAATLLIIGFPSGVLALLGTPGELLAPAGEYLFWFTLFLMPVGLFDILMFAVRLDDSPNFVMGCNMLAAGLNIFLDWLFIFVFGWGLAGAAVATGVGYALGAALMLGYMLRRSRTIRFTRLKMSWKSLRLTLRNTLYMAYAGFPAMLNELAISCLMVVGNYTFLRYLGKDGVAAYSIACYLFPIIFMLYSGIVQAAQPILSFNYGAGSLGRVRQALRLSLATAAGCGLLLLAATLLFAPGLAGLFLAPDAPAYAIAGAGLPLFAAGYPFFGINVVAIGYYQSLERSRLAMGLTFLRGIVLTMAAYLLLPRLLGVTGIWLAVPAAEAATTILIIFALYKRHDKR